MIDTVLFDLDGTLVDSLSLHAITLRQLLSDKLGIETNLDELRTKIIGIPSQTIMGWYVNHDRILEMILAWSEYEVPHLPELRLFPGMREALKVLTEHGIRIGVVTSQNRDEMGLMKSYIGLDDLINAWICIDDVCCPKPAPEPVQFAIETLGSHPENTLMIGDTPFDLSSAQAAGCQSGAAMWGFGDHQALQACHPDFTFCSPYEILSAVGISNRGDAR